MEITKIKLISAIFAATVLVGCASTDTTDRDEAARMAAEAEARAAAEMQSAADAAAAAAAAEEARLKAEMLANLENVFYFDFDQATLSSQARSDLDAQIAVLKDTNSKIRLEGHGDERGTREYNMALGERRANSVANYMVINGVARYRVETVSFGEEQPMDTGSSATAWGKNRRVELR